MGKIILGDSPQANRLTVANLRARKQEVRRVAEELEEKAAETRRQAEMYSQAKESLTQRLAEAEERLAECESRSDAATAENLRHVCRELQDAIDRNSKLAEQRSELASEHEVEYQNCKSLLAKLEAQIQARLESQG